MDLAKLVTAPSAATGTQPSPATPAARDAALDPRLVAAAHQFEATLLAELLKPLDRSSEAEQSEGEESADGSGGALMSFGSEALAKALSDKGGLGIARRVLDHFDAAAESAHKPERRAEDSEPTTPKY